MATTKLIILILMTLIMLCVICCEYLIDEVNSLITVYLKQHQSTSAGLSLTIRLPEVLYYVFIELIYNNCCCSCCCCCFCCCCNYEQISRVVYMYVCQPVRIQYTDLKLLLLLLLLLSRQDPMNFGAVIRSSYFLGVDNIFVVKENR